MTDEKKQRGMHGGIAIAAMLTLALMMSAAPSATALKDNERGFEQFCKVLESLGDPDYEITADDWLVVAPHLPLKKYELNVNCGLDIVEVPEKIDVPGDDVGVTETCAYLIELKDGSRLVKLQCAWASIYSQPESKYGENCNSKDCLVFYYEGGGGSLLLPGAAAGGVVCTWNPSSLDGWNGCQDDGGWSSYIEGCEIGTVTVTSTSWVVLAATANSVC